MIFSKMDNQTIARPQSGGNTLRFKVFLVISILLVTNTAWPSDDADTNNALSAIEKVDREQKGNDPEKELKERFEVLKDKAEDKDLGDNVRIDTFLEIGNLELSIATQYLIDNIDHQIPIRWSADDDYLRERPCYYALLRKKEKVVPEVLISLERERDQTSVKWIARLLDTTIGLGKATEILERRGREVKDDPDYSVLVKNIKQIIQQLEEIRERREKDRQEN